MADSKTIGMKDAKIIEILPESPNENIKLIRK